MLFYQFFRPTGCVLTSTVTVKNGRLRAVWISPHRHTECVLNEGLSLCFPNRPPNDPTGSNIQNTTYMQNFTQAARTDKHSWLGELLFKWSMTPKDYFAAHGYADISRDKTHGEGKGLFMQTENEAYAFNSNGNDKSLIATTSLYYKHSFSDDNTIEVRLAYNFNRDNYSETRTEQYGDNTTGSETLFKSRRHSGSLMIDYARDFKNGTSIAFGSHTSLKHDNIANRAALFTPAFVHEELNQYYTATLMERQRTYITCFQPA